jgi:hypothetical protein
VLSSPEKKVRKHTRLITIDTDNRMFSFKLIIAFPVTNRQFGGDFGGYRSSTDRKGNNRRLTMRLLVSWFCLINYDSGEACAALICRGKVEPWYEVRR